MSSFLVIFSYSIDHVQLAGMTRKMILCGFALDGVLSFNRVYSVSWYI